ncbi:hypothetical protein FEP41_05319 [Burkholderia multivorans]|nr:hypothetical protein [Burkholderia multivorans]
MRASHHMNFWIGAWSVGASPCVSAAGPSNVSRFGSQLADARLPPSADRKPGVRRIAKPRKSARDCASGQSKASRTRVGDR